MKRLIIAAISAAAIASGACAQLVQTTPAIGPGTFDPTIVNRSGQVVGGIIPQVQITGSGSSSSQVQGNIASGSVDTGNPVKIGCIYTTTRPSFATGQRGDCQITSKGALASSLEDGVGNMVGVQVSGADGISNTNINALKVFNFPSLWSGANWNRQAGDTTGIWLGGHASLNTGQISVGTTATLISAARTGRQSITVDVTTAVQCAYGNSGVTLTTGFPLAAVAYAAQKIDTAAALYGVCASTATVGYMEQY